MHLVPRQINFVHVQRTVQSYLWPCGSSQNCTTKSAAKVRANTFSTYQKCCSDNKNQQRQADKLTFTLCARCLQSPYYLQPENVATPAPLPSTLFRTRILCPTGKSKRKAIASKSAYPIHTWDGIKTASTSMWTTKEWLEASESGTSIPNAHSVSHFPILGFESEPKLKINRISFVCVVRRVQNACAGQPAGPSHTKSVTLILLGVGVHCAAYIRDQTVLHTAMQNSNQHVLQLCLSVVGMRNANAHSIADTRCPGKCIRNDTLN